MTILVSLRSRDLSILTGDGSNTVPKKGGDGIGHSGGIYGRAPQALPELGGIGLEIDPCLMGICARSAAMLYA